VSKVLIDRSTIAPDGVEIRVGHHSGGCQHNRSVTSKIVAASTTVASKRSIERQRMISA
jgi:hypothetical protein